MLLLRLPDLLLHAPQRGWVLPPASTPDPSSRRLHGDLFQSGGFTETCQDTQEGRGLDRGGEQVKAMEVFSLFTTQVWGQASLLTCSGIFRNNLASFLLHRAFREGVKKHGWGAWTRIAEDCLTTRTRQQIGSHAQKLRDRQKMPLRCRTRTSIFDASPGLTDLA